MSKVDERDREAARRAPIRYYQQGDAWWAEDDDMPGWTGAAESLVAVIQMHHDAKLVLPMLEREARARLEGARAMQEAAAKAADCDYAAAIRAIDPAAVVAAPARGET